jgi:hypothetical protein
VKSWHLQGCSPRLCWLRTDGLGPTSKYWTYRSHARDMGPVSLVAGRQHKVGFAPTTSVVVLGEKLGMESMDPSAGLLWIMSGAVAQLNSVDDYMKGCYALTA